MLLLVVILTSVGVLLHRRRPVICFPFVPSRPHHSLFPSPSRASTADFSAGRLGIPAPRAKVHPPSVPASASASACTTGPTGHTVRRPSASHPPRCPPTVWFGIKLLLLWGCGGGGGGGCGPGLVSAQSSLSCPAGSYANATASQCVTCPGGVFCVGGVNPAIACPAGMRLLSPLRVSSVPGACQRVRANSCGEIPRAMSRELTYWVVCVCFV